MKPESFTRLLHENWKLISSIYSEVKDQPFHESLCFKILKNLDPVTFTFEQGYKTIETLKKEGLLESVPRSDREFEFFHPLLPFIESLLEEQKLSLHSELIVRIEALNSLKTKLEQSILNRDISSYHNTCNEMDRLLRNLKSQVDDSISAVNRLVEEAKLYPKTMSLKTRYSKTLDAWDHFVRPVLDMCNPGTPFSTTLAAIENSLLLWIDEQHYGFLSLESDLKRLEVLHGRMLDFQSALAHAITNMGKQIYPIVHMVRLNTQVTRGATLALRKLEHNSPKSWIKEIEAGLTKAKPPTRHGSAATIESFIRVVIDNADREDDIPEISTTDFDSLKANRDNRASITAYEIVRDVRKKLPVYNILSFIHTLYPNIDLKTLVTSYTKLARTEGFYVFREDESVELTFDNRILAFRNRHILRKTNV
ncbi:hypothetical protein ACI2KR_07880 [Pseudomonas luteola]